MIEHRTARTRVKRIMYGRQGKQISIYATDVRHIYSKRRERHMRYILKAYICELNIKEMQLRFLVGLLLVAVAFVSCDKDNNQREEDARLIEEYVLENGLDAQSTESGLHYVIDEPGNDEHPNLSHDISIIYTGRLLNGNQFDSSNGNTVTFPLDALIEGWQEGIPLFGKGGKGTLIIPSHLGYGSRGAGSVPPNAVLVFDIELVDFN